MPKLASPLPSNFSCLFLTDGLGGVICDVSICDQVKELALCELWGYARDLPSYNETEERWCHTVDGCSPLAAEPGESIEKQQQ